jgi:hypothetical protein
MIVEMRTYRVKPGSIPEVVKRFGEALEKSGRNKVAPLGGFFHTEVGPLNRIIHCWPYESLGAREKLRAEAMKLPGWPPPIGEFIVEMESKIINLAPFSPKLGDRRLGDIYEIRTYTMQPGGVGIVTEAWAEKIEGRQKFSPLAFCGSTELGGLNQWIHVWAYKDVAERFSVRDAARASGAWPPNTRGQFIRQENMLVIPAAFSPLH